jgi:regulatory protein
MKVTALKLQSRNKTRVNVFLDGEFVLGLAKILAVRLRVGQELTDAEVERLRAADAEEEAHTRAVNLIARRPRSEAEVRQRLQRAGVAAPVIAAVLERLRGSGLLDDEAFAKYWVENRAAFRPRSKRALQMELKRKGISPTAVEDVLQATDDAEAAYALALKRARQLTHLPAPDFRRKLSDYLARRGFDYETVEAIVRRVMAEVSSPKSESE